MNNTQETKSKKSVETGDVWQLGDHRLACGSASDAELIEKVKGGDLIRQILTDPPYGVNYVEGKTQISNTTEIQGDQLQSDEQYAEFTKKWLEVTTGYLEKYNTIYIFNSDIMFCALRAGMKQADIYYSQLIIWVKDRPVLGRKDYLPQHELIAYGWYGRHKMERSKAKTVLFYPKPHQSKLHPTMKPIGLLRQLILNSTKINDVVYDPFGGSGSTLLDCEHLKRKCVMIEIDPNHCSTIIQRWEILTGREALKL